MGTSSASADANFLYQNLPAADLTILSDEEADPDPWRPQAHCGINVGGEIEWLYFADSCLQLYESLSGLITVCKLIKQFGRLICRTFVIRAVCSNYPDL